MVKNFLFFSDFGRGYLRVWPTLLRPAGYEGQAFWHCFELRRCRQAYHTGKKRFVSRRWSFVSRFWTGLQD